MKLQNMFIWFFVSVLLIVSIAMLTTIGQPQKVDIALDITDFSTTISADKPVKLENGTALSFVSIGSLKIGSPWRVLIHTKNGDVSLDQGTYQFLDGVYEVKFEGDIFHLTKK